MSELQGKLGARDEGEAQPARRGPQDHPMRYHLTNELHARPFEKMVAPEQATLYAMTTGEGTDNLDREHLGLLCDRYGLHPPAPEASHFSADFGSFRLRWERHTEFTTYTFMRAGPFEDAFRQPAASFVPDDWISNLPGQLLVAVHVALIGKDHPVPDAARLKELFVPESLVSSVVGGGDAAQVWTDLRIHEDGHNRILLRDNTMHPRKAGRIVQRMLEIATYRNMALLAHPVARDIAPKLADIDDALAALTKRISADSSQEGDAVLLQELTGLSAAVEHYSSSTAYRFSASRAYYALIQSRIVDLREERVDQYQTISEFLERRLAPAMRTCESVNERLEDLSRRANRTANLLRTRVDFALEAQNQDLLTAMARRSRLQLRLQETVEGLSVAAISYYLVGLVTYLAKAGKDAGLPVSPDIVAGASIPLVVGLVWYGVRRAKRAILKLEKGDM